MVAITSMDSLIASFHGLEINGCFGFSNTSFPLHVRINHAIKSKVVLLFILSVKFLE